jgi:hypothetical protein
VLLQVDLVRVEQDGGDPQCRRDPVDPETQEQPVKGHCQEQNEQVLKGADERQ